MELKDFIDIARYASENWRGKFAEREIAEYAQELYDEFNKSVENKFPTEIINSLMINLITDWLDNDVEFTVVDWMANIEVSMSINYMVARCNTCNKKEIYFFTESERDMLSEREYGTCNKCIQDILPRHSAMVREFYVSGQMICPECWKKQFSI